MPALRLWLVFVLVAAGGLTIAAGEELEAERLATAGLVVALAGLVLFGLDIVIRRRAELATARSSVSNPTFHVFHGGAAVAWGVAFTLFAGTLAALAVGRAVGWTGLEHTLRDHPVLLLMLGGAIVTAIGAGSVGRATYRSGEVERPDARPVDRLYGVATIVVGVCMLSAAAVQVLAPETAGAVKDWASRQIVEALR